MGKRATWFIYVQSRYKEIELRPFFGASYLKNYFNFDDMVTDKNIPQ